jgi:hypothetical protein
LLVAWIGTRASQLARFNSSQSVGAAIFASIVRGH